VHSSSGLRYTISVTMLAWRSGGANIDTGQYVGTNRLANIGPTLALAATDAQMDVAFNILWLVGGTMFSSLRAPT
jgi:hypothetical protein